MGPEVSMQKGTRQSEDARRKIREARAKQVHPRLAARGISQEEVLDAASRGLRWCSGVCKRFLPVAEFSGDGAKKCRNCTAASVARRRSRWTGEERLRMAESIKRWREINPAHEKRWRLFQKYGVTPDWYETTLAQQSGVCALCGGDVARQRSHFFCVDHDHSTGKVRGLLCTKCNTALERVERISGWAERAVEYLARYRE